MVPRSGVGEPASPMRFQFSPSLVPSNPLLVQHGGGRPGRSLLATPQITIISLGEPHQGTDVVQECHCPAPASDSCL